MQKIYVAQTALKFEVDTSIDLSAATSALIKYIKPDKTTGSWTATIEAPAASGIISYTIASASDLDASGKWQLWAYITFSDASVAPGDPVEIKVYEEGT